MNATKAENSSSSVGVIILSVMDDHRISTDQGSLTEVTQIIDPPKLV